MAGMQQREHHPEGEEVEDRAHRAEHGHEAPNELHVPRRRPGQRLGVDLVGRDHQLTGVVEQIVEEDLRRQHRKERQEHRGSGRTEHVAEVRGRGHQDVLHGVGEDATALHHTFGEHPEILVEQHHVGGVLGHVGSRVHRDPDISVVQRHRVVHPVAEVRHVPSGAAGHLDDPRLLIGADPGEHRRGQDRRLELVVVEGLDLRAAAHARAFESDVRAHLGCHQAVVPGDDLHLHAQPLELGDGGAGVCLRTVGEGQEPDQRQPLFGRGGERLHVTCRAGGHGHHPGSFVEQCLQRWPGAVRNVHAPLQNYLGCSLGDQEWLARGILDQHGDQLALVVERKHALSHIADGRGGDLTSHTRPGGRPQRLVQRVAPDRALVGDRRFVAHQPEQQRAVTLLPVSVESPLEGDRPLGEGAGLVGEEDLDVAQVLDGDQPLDQHLLRHEGPRACGEADRHDGGHHLGGDADGDRQ